MNITVMKPVMPELLRSVTKFTVFKKRLRE